MALSTNRKRLVGFFMLTLTLAAVLAACGGKGTPPNLFNTYRVSGTLVVDMNRDSVYVSIRLFEANNPATAATIKLEGRSLVYNSASFPVDSVFSIRLDSAMQYVNRVLVLSMSDTTGFDDTLFVRVPDTFSIINVIPFNHQTQGLESVSLSWSGSAGSNGYVMAAVQQDSAYSEYGYSLLPTPNTGTGGTIPPEAFSLGPSNNPDTGLYNLYVYARGAITDSAQSSPLLPVPLPANLIDTNIVKPNFFGQFGSILVAPKDTVRVVTNP